MATTTPTAATLRSVTGARPSPMVWLRAGAAGGMLAGAAFAMFEMLAAVVQNGTGAFFMPLRMIGAIALGQGALDPASALLPAAAAGLMVHMALSMMYGVAVAALIALVPVLNRSADTILAIAGAAGFALWAVNFLVLARALGWPWFPDTQHVGVQIVAHVLVFGGLLGLLLDRMAFARGRQA